MRNVDSMNFWSRITIFGLLCDKKLTMFVSSLFWALCAIFVYLLFKALLKARTIAAEDQCDLYLAPSTLPGAGRGVIAGRAFKTDEIVDKTITLTVGIEHAVITQLNNYVFSTVLPEFSSVIFGAGALYNHMEQKTVEHYWNSKVLVSPALNPLPHSTANNILFRAVQPVKVGQELYSNYGKTWFAERRLAEQKVGKMQNAVKTAERINTPVFLTQAELKKHGHCLTHVGIEQSTFPQAGQGLFAKKSFAAGQIVTIAPVLTLPHEVVERTRSSSVLMNYCITVAPGCNSTEVTLFPLTNAVLINHQPTGRANLRMEWFDWSAAPSAGSYYEHLGGNAVDLGEKLRQTPSELFAAPFAQFDIAYVALRDIVAGEELSYDYGEEWVASWEQYTEDMRRWEETQPSVNSVQTERIESTFGGVSEVSVREGSRDQIQKPTMRAFIQAPADMFPDHWMRGNK